MGHRDQPPTKRDVLCFASRLASIRLKKDVVVGNHFWKHLMKNCQGKFGFVQCKEKSAARIEAEQIPVIQAWLENLQAEVEKYSNKKAAC